MDPISKARALQAGGRLSEAASVLGSVLRADPNNAEAMQLLGVIQFQLGYQRDGIKLAQRATEVDPSNGESWNNLGLMYHMMGNADSALAAFQRSVGADPALTDAWKNLGYTLYSKHQFHEALDALEQAGDSIDARFFRANCYAALGYAQMALTEYDSVLSDDPEHGAAWQNRGNALLEMGRPQEGIESMKQAIKRLGRDLLAHCNLGRALVAAGKADEGLAIVNQVLKWDPSFGPAQQVKAEAEQALRSQQEYAARLGGETEDESTVEQKAAVAKDLQAQGRWSDAIAALGEPRDAGLRFLKAMLLPIVCDSRDAVDEALGNLDDEIRRLREDRPTLKDPLAQVGLTTFHLPYFGVSDRKHQEEIALAFRECAPSLSFEASHSPSLGRPRLGVLTACLSEHTVNRVFGGLIERLDRERFEIVYLQVGRPDAFSERMAKTLERHVVVQGTLAEARETVANEKLDVLFYPEIGMNPLTYYLAFSRLAPVQCTTWGRPVTSGSPTIDHYLSSPHLEREDGQREYTEKLSLAETLSFYYPRPASPPELPRSSFGLPEDVRLYGCPQMAFKFHPDFDRALNRILEQDPDGRILLVEPQNAHFKEIILDRWRRSHPVLVEKALWMPPLPLEQFLRLLQLCDALLAPIQFGGGRSTLDSLGVDAPVVTFKGPFLKSRITYAMYRQMGMGDLIAETEEQYVDLAVRLAKDRGFRGEMRRKVRELSPAIYENRQAVRDYNAFFASIAPHGS